MTDSVVVRGFCFLGGSHLLRLLPCGLLLRVFVLVLLVELFGDLCDHDRAGIDRGRVVHDRLLWGSVREGFRIMFFV